MAGLPPPAGQGEELAWRLGAAPALAEIVLVEFIDVLILGRIDTLPVAPRPLPLLGPLADPPILPVHQVVEFHDLVNRQDWGICERAQKGQRSRGYRQGVYPPQDEYVYEFDQHYLRERGRGPETPG